MKDLTGKIFGRLTVISFSHKEKDYYWLCVCECGTKKVLRISNLISKNTQSCGCLNRENLKNNNRNWSGENVEYRGLHDRLYPLVPNRELCLFCKKNTKTQLANISKKYKTNISDWMWLCQPCHKKYDAGWVWSGNLWSKVCKPCGRFLIVSTDNFYKYINKKTNKIHFSSKCKECENKRKSKK